MLCCLPIGEIINPFRIEAIFLGRQVGGPIARRTLRKKMDLASRGIYPT
jgi:hypothetical protein